MDIGKYIMQFIYSTQGAEKVVTTNQLIEQSQQRLTTSTKKSGAGMNDFVLAMRRALIVAPVWMALRSAMMGVMQLFQSSIKFIIDWEKEMMKIKIVTKGSAEDYDRLSKSLIRLSAVYGASTTQLAQAAELWGKQGKSLREIVPLMQTTIRYSIITGREMVTSVEDITSIMKNYGIESTNVRKIVDSLSEVEDKHAISADVLSEALRAVGASSAGVNISFDKMLGIITATHIATRAAGTSIGSAWVSIFSRMSKTALPTIQNIADIPMFMDKAGASTKENTGTFRNFGNVLDDLSFKISTLNEKDRMRVLQDIAGIRRYALLKSAIDQWSEGLQATIDSLDSYGDADRDINMMLETTDAKLKQLSATWFEYVNMIGNTDLMKNAIDSLKEYILYLQRAQYYFRGGILAGTTGFILNLPSTPELGMFYDNLKDIQKIREDILKGSEKEVEKNQLLVEASKQLLSLTQRRAELLASGKTSESPEIINRDKAIKTLAAKLGQYKEFADLNNMFIEQMPGKLSEIIPTVEESLISSQAVSKTQQAAEKIKTQIDDIRLSYNKLATDMAAKGTTGIPMHTQTNTLQELQKGYVDLYTQLKGINTHVLAAFSPNVQKKIENMKLLLGYLSEEISLRAELGKTESSEVSKDITNTLRDEADAKRKIEEQDKKELELTDKMNELQIKAIRTRMSKLDLVKEELDLQKNFEATDEKAQKKQIQALELERAKLEEEKKINAEKNKQVLFLERLKGLGYSEIQLATVQLSLMEQQGALLEDREAQQQKINMLQEQEAQSVLDKILNYEESILKIKGNSELATVQTMIALKDQLGLQTDVVQQLDDELTKRRLILETEKNLNSETLTLYKMHEKYGDRAVSMAERVLKGEEDYNDQSKRDKAIFKEYFSAQADIFEAQKWLKNEGRQPYGVPTEEETAEQTRKTLQDVNNVVTWTKEGPIKKAISSTKEVSTNQNILQNIADMFKQVPAPVVNLQIMYDTKIIANEIIREGSQIQNALIKVTRGKGANPPPVD